MSYACLPRKLIRLHVSSARPSMENGGYICFERIRHLGSRISGETVDQHTKQKLVGLTENLLNTRLLPSLSHQRWPLETRTAICLCVLELCREIDINIPKGLLNLTKLSFPQLSEFMECLSSHVQSKYDADQRLALTSWLAQLIGKQVSTQQTEHLGRANSSSKSNISISAHEFWQLGVVLNSLLNHSVQDNVSSQHIAFDAFVASTSWNEEDLRFLKATSSLLSTATKVKLWNLEWERLRIEAEKRRMFDEIYAGSNYLRASNGVSSQFQIHVSRESLVEDSIKQLSPHNTHCDAILWQNIRLVFEGEEGQDAGGLLKEWILLVTEQIVPELFYQAEKEAKCFTAKSKCKQNLAHLFGALVAIALRHSIVLDVPLSKPLLQSVVQVLPTDEPSLNIQNLHETHPSFSRGLQRLQDWDEAIDGNIEDVLAINFTFVNEDGDSIELIPGGHSISVKADNRAQYIHSILDYMLQRRTCETIRNMRSGFRLVSPDLRSLALFSSEELKGLLCGQESVPSVVALRAASTIERTSPSSFEADSTFLAAFWHILSSMEREDVRRFLHFVTASYRIPLSRQDAFLEHAVPAINIVLTGNRADGGIQAPLPTASTCTNTLFLPRYSSPELLSNKLFLALREASQGFGRA